MKDQIVFVGFADTKGYRPFLRKGWKRKVFKNSVNNFQECISEKLGQKEIHLGISAHKNKINNQIKTQDMTYSIPQGFFVAAWWKR